MPPIEEADLWQTATLWPATGRDNRGRVTIGARSEVSCRWWEQLREATDPQGNVVAVDATVIVAQEIAIDSIMRLGDLSDWTGTGSGADDSELMRVATRSWTPDLKGGRFARYEYGLQRFRNTIPATT